MEPKSNIGQTPSANQIYTSFEDLPEDCSLVLQKQLPDTDFGAEKPKETQSQEKKPEMKMEIEIGQGEAFF